MKNSIPDRLVFPAGTIVAEGDEDRFRMLHSLAIATLEELILVCNEGLVDRSCTLLNPQEINDFRFVLNRVGVLRGIKKVGFCVYFLRNLLPLILRRLNALNGLNYSKNIAERLAINPIGQYYNLDDSGCILNILEKNTLNELGRNLIGHILELSRCSDLLPNNTKRFHDFEEELALEFIIESGPAPCRLVCDGCGISMEGDNRAVMLWQLRNYSRTPEADEAIKALGTKESEFLLMHMYSCDGLVRIVCTKES